MSTPHNAMRAVIMTRVSTRARAQEASPEIQERACRQFCELHGLEVREVISETFTGRKLNYTDKTGKTHVREGLQRVYDMLERGLIDVVVFHKIDRIARNGDITRDFARGIYKRNGKVGVAVKGVVYDTFFKFRQQGLLDITVAEHEVLGITERLVDGREARAGLGSFLRNVNYGYRLVRDPHNRLRKIPDIDPYYGPIVREILTRIASGEPVSKIARSLNENGIKTPKNTEWSHYTIRHLAGFALRYAGQPFSYSYYSEEMGKNIEVTYTYPPLIDEPTAVRILQRMSVRTKRESSAAHPFAGMVRCGCCGERATVKRNDWKNGKTTWESYRYTCRSLARNELRKTNGQQLEPTKCQYRISHRYLVEKLRNFLAVENFGIFKSNFERVIAEKCRELHEMEIESQSLELVAEELKEKSLKFKKIIEKLVLDEGSVEVLKEIANQKKTVDAELDQTHQRINQLKAKVEALTMALHRYGIGPNALTALQMTAIALHEPERQLEVFNTLIKRRDEGNVIEASALMVFDKLQKIVRLLDAKKWSKVNELLTSLSIRFAVDFSEPDETKRRASVRVFVDFDALQAIYHQRGPIEPPSSTPLVLDTLGLFDLYTRLLSS